MFKKRFGIILTSIFLISCMAINASAAPSSHTLNATQSVIQERSNWCWAASAVCVARYFGDGIVNQSSMALMGLGSVTNSSATMTQTRTALQSNCHITGDITTKLSRANVEAEIYTSSRPILCGLTSPANHMVVLYGYNWNTSYQYYFMDPRYGRDQHASESSFNSLWSQSLWHLRKY